MITFCSIDLCMFICSLISCYLILHGLRLCRPRVCVQVTNFLREESRENMQIIVISLKEEFFSKSDALLGVYSDVTNFKILLTLILRFPLSWRRTHLWYSLLHSSMNACLVASWPWTCSLTRWLRRAMSSRSSLESPVWSLCLCGFCVLAIKLESLFSSFDSSETSSSGTTVIISMSHFRCLLCTILGSFTKLVLLV